MPASTQSPNEHAEERILRVIEHIKPLVRRRWKSVQATLDPAFSPTDIVQESFARAMSYEEWQTFSTTTLNKLTYTISCRRLFDICRRLHHYRRTTARAPEDLEQPRTSDVDIGNAVFRNDLASLFTEAEYSFMLLRLAGLSIKDCAEAAGMPYTVARVMNNVVRDRLQGYLDDDN